MHAVLYACVTGWQQKGQHFLMVKGLQGTGLLAQEIPNCCED